jgi:O-methyltransferase
MADLLMNGTAAEDLYLDLLKKCLTRYEMGERYEAFELPRGSWRRRLYAPLRRFLASRELELVRTKRFDPQARAEGRDWPLEAETMIGLRRLEHLQYCVRDVIRRQVPGDLIETGVWRGGASIFMRAVLKVHGDATRIVWVADSFQGLPPPDAERYPADAGDRLWAFSQLRVPLEQVKTNFARYGLLDGQVRFVVGWFKDTLPTIQAERFALLRLDGDLYESTMDALRHLYPKLSVGGYVIIDDYGAIPACKAAVDDFRAQHAVTDKVEAIDWTGVFWQRTR